MIDKGAYLGQVWQNEAVLQGPGEMTGTVDEAALIELAEVHCYGWWLWKESWTVSPEFGVV
jgi:hypothetical protein